MSDHVVSRQVRRREAGYPTKKRRVKKLVTEAQRKQLRWLEQNNAKRIIMKRGEFNVDIGPTKNGFWYALIERPGALLPIFHGIRYTSRSQAKRTVTRAFERFIRSSLRLGAYDGADYFPEHLKAFAIEA